MMASAFVPACRNDIVILPSRHRLIPDAEKRFLGLLAVPTPRTCHKEQEDVNPYTERLCRSCGNTLPLDHFRTLQGPHSRRRHICIECDTLATAAETADKTYNRHLRNTYGITLAQYNWMLETQGGVCAICRQPERVSTTKHKAAMRLAVDHDHHTGQIRALLCSRCNTGIGSFGHDPALMRAAIHYLDKTTLRRRKPA